MRKLKEYRDAIVLTATLVLLLLWLCGCTTYHVKIGEAEATVSYLLQDKKFKAFSYDPETHRFSLEEFGSETSQIVGEAIRAALLPIVP